jgi:hypothetical protein
MDHSDIAFATPNGVRVAMTQPFVTRCVLSVSSFGRAEQSCKRHDDAE